MSTRASAKNIRRIRLRVTSARLTQLNDPLAYLQEFRLLQPTGLRQLSLLSPAIGSIYILNCPRHPLKKYVGAVLILYVKIISIRYLKPLKIGFSYLAALKITYSGASENETGTDTSAVRNLSGWVQSESFRKAFCTSFLAGDDIPSTPQDDIKALSTKKWAKRNKNTIAHHGSSLSLSAIALALCGHWKEMVLHHYGAVFGSQYNVDLKAI
jgi:hypothetical protein